MPERWRPVVGYEGIYEVSDQGRVRSVSRLTSHGRQRAGTLLRALNTPKGYLVVNLSRSNRICQQLVHRLVLKAFCGEPPDGMEALHGDGDPSNNTLANLRWGTHSENQADQVAHGTHPNAAKTSCAAGHPYDDSSTYAYPGRSKRGCRTCRREHTRNRRRAA